MTDEVVVQPSWFIDEGRPGDGDRPAWLGEKFKTAADLAKSYSELEKKFSTAPEEYDVSKSKFIDPDYVPFQELLAHAKEKRVPKSVVDKMVDSLDKYMDEFKIDYAEETKKLGPNSKERLTTLDNWAKAHLTEESYSALTGNLKTADAIKALEELRGKMMSNNTVVPNGNDGAASNVQSLDDIRTELSNNLGKYKTDPKYQADIRARLEIAAKTSNYIDKSGF
jgi:hypothetical protein